MLCILCLTTSDQIIHIFDENGIRLNVSVIITKHLWLQPSAEDDNTKIICCSCWNALRSFHEFYQQVEEAHAKLSNLKRPIEYEASERDDFDTYPDFFSEDIKLETSNDSKIDKLQFSPAIQLDATQTNEDDVKDVFVKSDSESDVPLVELTKRGKSTKECKAERISAIATDSDSLTNKRTRKVEDDSDYDEPKTEGKRNYDLNNKRVPCKEFDGIIQRNMELSCEICHSPFNSFFVLKEHYQSVHDEIGYATCCERKFESRHALVHHILLHQNPDTFKCEKCGRILANKKSLKNHMKKHMNEERIFQCEKCRKSFSRKQKLDRHMKTHVRLEQICEQCGKITRDKHALRQHQLREHSGVPRKRVQCQKCGVYLADSSTLHTHMKYQHPKTDVIHVCNICGKISTTGYGLKRHILYMHKCERRHKCPMCEKAFKAAHRLREPYQSVHNEIGYVICCEKKFDSRHVLVQHIMLHQNPEFFKCEKCDKILSNRRYLKNHMKKHENEERVHQCEKCKKSFAKIVFVRCTK